MTAAAPPELLLVFETEAACHTRLIAGGFSAARAGEITSYLAQSTDLALEFETIGPACAERGIGFVPVELDRAAAVFAGRDPSRSLVWTLTDGIAYFRGGASPALARLNGLATVGSDDAAFALCQDKFRAGSVLASLGLPAPASGLARNGEWVVPPPALATGYFVKPNRLGAKIGIWEDSHCRTPGEALALSRRIFDAYRDDALVQAYVPGRNVRASFLAVDPDAGADALSAFFVESGGDFQTMADSMALHGDTGAAARQEERYAEPELLAVEATQPDAAARISEIAAQLMRGLGLRDVFSIDLRVEAGGAIHLIEFEVCPGLPCFDFRAYCEQRWALGLAEAMAATAAARFSRR